MTSPVEIIYEEGPVLAVNKPSGLLTQAAPGIDNMELRVKLLFKYRDHKTGNIYLGVPHRLDRPASGVLLLAKHTRATRRISEQFEGRLVKKTYWAIVQGNVQPESGTWQDYMRKIPDQAKAEITPQSHDGAREAILHYQKIQTIGDHSLLQIELETGRTHQIRLQAASRGHPILGDELYGSQLPFGEAFEDPRLRAIAHACENVAIFSPHDARKNQHHCSSKRSLAGNVRIRHQTTVLELTAISYYDRPDLTISM